MVEFLKNPKSEQKEKDGDTICFKSKADKLIVTVKAVHIFRNFEKLYVALPLDKCGYTADKLATTSPDDMLEYYTKEQIEKYGVVGNEIEI